MPALTDHQVDSGSNIQTAVEGSLASYYGVSLAGPTTEVAVGPAARRRQAAKRRARSGHGRWLSLLESLQQERPSWSFVDASRMSFWYSFLCDAIPYPGMAAPSALDEYQPALAAKGDLVVLTIAASTLCPVFHMQPYHVRLGAHGYVEASWTGQGSLPEDVRSALADVSAAAGSLLRTQGYMALPPALFCRELPGFKMDFVTGTPMVKDLLFGPFTFGEVPPWLVGP